MAYSTNNLNLKVAAALTFMVFVLDMLVPLGFTIGALYFFCFLFILNQPPKLIKLFAGLVCFLIVLKFAIFYHPNANPFSFVNRCISVSVILATAWLALHHRQMLEQSTQAINEKNSALIEIEQRFKQQMDNMLEGVQIIGFDWKYKYVNEALIKQSKYFYDELIGFTMMNRYPGIEKTAMFEALERCMYGRSLERLENEFTYPDGTKGEFELIMQPIPEGIFILSLDISERKKSEQERKQQIKTLEELLFMISHKVRQPVATLLGITNSLNHDELTPQEWNEISKFIADSAVKLDVLTRELNDLVIKSRGNNTSETKSN